MRPCRAIRSRSRAAATSPSRGRSQAAVFQKSSATIAGRSAPGSRTRQPLNHRDVVAGAAHLEPKRSISSGTHVLSTTSREVGKPVARAGPAAVVQPVPRMRPRLVHPLERPAQARSLSSLDSAVSSSATTPASSVARSAAHGTVRQPVRGPPLIVGDRGAGALAGAVFGGSRRKTRATAERDAVVPSTSSAREGEVFLRRRGRRDGRRWRVRHRRCKQQGFAVLVAKVPLCPLMWSGQTAFEDRFL